jgi:hypothetical protein
LPLSDVTLLSASKALLRTSSSLNLSRRMLTGPEWLSVVPPPPSLFASPQPATARESTSARPQKLVNRLIFM